VGAWTLNRDLEHLPDERETPPRLGAGAEASRAGGIGGRGSLLGHGGNSPSDDEMHKAW
jgi:hypothetical protein